MDKECLQTKTKGLKSKLITNSHPLNLTNRQKKKPHTTILHKTNLCFFSFFSLPRVLVPYCNLYEAYLKSARLANLSLYEKSIIVYNMHYVGAQSNNTKLK